MKRACAAAALGTTLAALAAAAQEPPQKPARVIPPGQEALLADMLGRGAGVLAKGCRFETAEVRRNFVLATYGCPRRSKAYVELHHPEASPNAPVRTGQFAILVTSGQASIPELMRAVAARVSAREKQFRWLDVRPRQGQEGGRG